jgi:predicted metal-binding membrane protein
MDNCSERAHRVDAQMPPVKAGWVCLAVAWALFIIPIPGTGIIGWALNLAAFIISIIVMVKGRVGAGVAQMVCALAVSPVIYFIGIGILGHFFWPRPAIHRLWL